MDNNDMSIAWDLETDVVVVGSGFAGLAAAIEARQAGCRVMILEKMKGFGGNSTISDGCVAAAGTALQRDAGIEDTPEKMYRDMLAAGLGLNQPELVRVVTHKSNETFEWTRDFLGVEYQQRVQLVEVEQRVGLPRQGAVAVVLGAPPAEVKLV